MNSVIQEPVCSYSVPNAKNLRVALYARVSTVGARIDPQDPETQLHRLRAYAIDQNYSVSKEYVDHVSGVTSSRPELDKMIADARDGKFIMVLVTKVDRMGRSVFNLLALLQELETYGVKFLCVDQPEISTKGPYGRLMMQMLAAFSEFELELIRERTRAGLERARADGKVLGRPRIVVDATEVLELLNRGHSLRQVADELGLSLGTVHRCSKKEGGKVPNKIGPDSPVPKTDDS